MSQEPTDSGTPIPDAPIRDRKRIPPEANPRGNAPTENQTGIRPERGSPALRRTLSWIIAIGIVLMVVAWAIQSVL